MTNDYKQLAGKIAEALDRQTDCHDPNCLIGDKAAIAEMVEDTLRAHKQPDEQKTPEELDAAIERFTKACAGAVPELERDEPEQPGAPADEPEEVAAEFNRRKWRGVDNWEARAGCEIVSAATEETVIRRSIYIEDARSLLAGWRAQDELAVQRMNTDSDRAYIALLTAENERLVGENGQVINRLAMFTRENECGHLSALEVLNDDGDPCCSQCWLKDTETELQILRARFKTLQEQAAQPPAQPDLDAIAKRLVDQVWAQVRAGIDGEMWLDNIKALAAVKAELRRLRAGPAEVWQPRATAPQDGSTFRAYGPSLVRADFNPAGSVEAMFDGESFIGAEWNPQHDCWSTVNIEFTHWQPLPAVPQSKEQPE